MALLHFLVADPLTLLLIGGQSGFDRLLRRKPGNEERRFLFVLFIRLAKAQLKL
jgi:hypothetical protein